MLYIQRNNVFVKVTIIGATLRGLHCASLLRDFGFRVDIIDIRAFKG